MSITMYVIAAGNRALTPFLNEQTPIVVDGVMYVTTSFAQAAAIDPTTGENLWTFDSESYKAGRPTNLGFVHRGPTFWSDGNDKRIFFATHDMKLWSLDADTCRRVLAALVERGFLKRSARGMYVRAMD